MTSDTERLFVSLEARIADFEKKFAQAERKGVQTYQKLQSGSATATGAMEADMVRTAGRINAALATVGVAFKGFVAGALATAATMSIGKVGELARQVAEVGNEAKRAGVSAQAFQEWKYVAEQNRVAVDSLIDGLKELNLRADEFVQTGKGPAAEAFQRLGYTAEDLTTKLEDPSALLLEIIDRLGEFDRAAQIRIADEVFGGTGGERFVELIDQGADGIQRTIAEAHDLGVVMDDELIARADDLNRMFGSVATTVGSALKSAIVSAAASLVDFLRLWRDFDQQTSHSLQNQLTDVQRRRGQLLDEKRTLEGEGLSQELLDLGFGAGSGARMEALKSQIDELTATEDEIIGVLQSRQPVIVPDLPDGDAWTPPTPPPGGFGSSSGASKGSGRSGGRGGAGARGDELDRETASIAARTAALQAQTEAQAALDPLIDDYGYAVERAAALQDLLTAAQEAGTEVTPELRTKLEELADAYARAHAAAGQLDDSQAEVVRDAEEMTRLRRDSVRGLADDLLAGRDAADALSDALARVGERLVDMALDGFFQAPPAGAAAGGGLFASIFGSLGSFFGGARASGGPVSAGRAYLVGERGPEMIVPRGAGTVVPNHELGGADGVVVTVNFAPSIDARGADSAAIARLEGMMRQQAADLDRSLRDRVIATMRDPRYRGRG